MGKQFVVLKELEHRGGSRTPLQVMAMRSTRHEALESVKADQSQVTEGFAKDESTYVLIEAEVFYGYQGQLQGADGREPA